MMMNMSVTRISCLALMALPAVMGFSVGHLPLRAGLPASSCVAARRSGVTSLRAQVEESSNLVPAIAAGIAGVGAAIGILAVIDQQGAKSADRLDDQLKTKLASKVDGGDAENKFSGTDQTIDALIANMEAAQGIKPAERAESKAAGKKASMEDDDGW